MRLFSSPFATEAGGRKCSDGIEVAEVMNLQEVRDRARLRRK